MIKKLFYFFKQNYNYKKIFKSKYIIIGEANSENILKYIPSKSSQVINFQTINIYLIIKLLILGKKITKLNYYRLSIELANPKIVVTMQDNDTDFYRLKKFFSNIKFISIQNGYRTEPKKTFLVKKGEKLKCDIIFCFGKQNINYYKSFINANVIPLGSVKNNMLSKNIYGKYKSVSYISEYRVNNENTKINFFNLGNIFWGDYIFYEKKLLRILGNYCKKNNIIPNIIGRFTDKNKNKEKLYFKKLLKSNFNYIEKKNQFSSYNALKRSNLIVSMSSSLGYEFLSRPNKIIFFSRPIRNLSFASKYYLFGWPSILQKRGFFFSNLINEKELSRLIKNLMNCPQKKWIKIKKPIENQIIAFNFNNRKLKKALKI
tara:strand:+ start:598 stop:1719 length:1122 start_codon:yes stop_codon:yes gene_type:complete